jgi:hypothetical protein
MHLPLRSSAFFFEDRCGSLQYVSALIRLSLDVLTIISDRVSYV